jgi:ABC-type glycerol-3-phosphate transport system substrate-binding protein
MDQRSLPVALSRRSLLCLVGGGIGTLLAACGPTAAPTSAPTVAPKPAGSPAAVTTAPAAAPAKSGAPVTLEFTSWGTDNGAWQKLVDAYMAKSAGVTVKLSPVPAENYYQQLQTAIAGGVKPDVASFQGWEWQPYAEKGVVADLDALIAADNFTGPWPDLDAVKTHTVWKGKRFHVPMQMAVMVMFYARKPFEEKGVKPPTDDWTMEQFMDLARQLSDPASKKFGLQANGVWARDIHWIRSTGKQEFDSIVEPKKATFNQPEIVEILQIVAADVYHKLKVSPTPSDLQGGANTIEAGSTAMKYEGPWFFPTLNDPKLRDQGKGVAFDVVMMPAGKDAKRPHRGWSEGVNLLKGERLDAAWQFAKFMAGEEGQKIYSETSGRIPNNADLAEKFWVPVARDRFGVQNARAFLEAFKRAVPDVIGEIPRSKMWAEVIKPVAWDPLIGGQAQAKDVLPQADAKLQAMLDDYWKNKK